ncbi:hypothetical protein [Singulisphaera sp. PoT]|uniref:hypothetical protein n=1 Tax=Singulisphaera sp. PoT TaxID=3411797 RepID=UPI003BF539DD
MFFTHHFAHQETLTRAHFWLTRLGFNEHEMQAHTHGTPRLTLSVESPRLPEVRLLINAVERSDPDSFASFWVEAKKHHPSEDFSNEVVDATGSQTLHANTIGWHPPDWSLAHDKELGALRELMSR